MPSAGRIPRWLEISLSADGETVEAVSELFNRYGCGGAVIEEILGDGERQTGRLSVSVIVKAFLPLDEEGRRKRRLLEEGLWHLSQLYPLESPRVRELAEEDWAEAWKRHYGLQRIGEGVVIVPSWQEYEPREGEVAIRLDPGMAFGTGLHPTTRMALIALERYMGKGMRVLDLGTGSGILAIATAKMGSSFVLGVDIDPVAVSVAKANVTANSLEGLVEIRSGSVEDIAPSSFHLVLMNISAEVISALAEHLAAVLAPGGMVVGAGIIEERQAKLEDKLSSLGFHILERMQERDWVTVVWRKGCGGSLPLPGPEG